MTLGWRIYDTTFVKTHRTIRTVKHNKWPLLYTNLKKKPNILIRMLRDLRMECVFWQATLNVLYDTTSLKRVGEKRSCPVELWKTVFRLETVRLITRRPVRKHCTLTKWVVAGGNLVSHYWREKLQISKKERLTWVLWHWTKVGDINIISWVSTHTMSPSSVQWEALEAMTSQ